MIALKVNLVKYGAAMAVKHSLVLLGLHSTDSGLNAAIIHAFIAMVHTMIYM